MRKTPALICLLAAGCLMAQTRGLTITTKSEAARAEFEKGWLCLDKQRTDVAKIHFEKAIQQDADFALAHLGLGLTTSTYPEQKQAISRAKNAAARASKMEQGFVTAMYYFFDNRLNDAQKQFQMLKKKYPKVETFWYWSAISHYANREYEAAVQEFMQVLEIHPEYHAAYNNLGYAYRDQGDYDKAKQVFIKYTELLPDEPNPHDSLADLYMTLGEYDKAIASYQAALKADPQFSMSADKIATCYLRTGRYDEAVAQLSDMVKSFSDPAVISAAYRRLADVYAGLGQSSVALEECELAEKTDPDTSQQAQASALAAKANVWSKAHRYEQARPLLEAALQKLPRGQQSPFIWAMANLEAEAGNLELAEKYSIQLQGLAEEQGLLKAYATGLNYLKAVIAREKGDYATAIAAFEKGGELNKSNPLAYRVDLAKVYFKNSDNAAARSALKPVLDQNPNDPEALLLLADLAIAEKDPDAADKSLTTLKTLLASADDDFYLLQEVKKKQAVAQKLQK
ncbi:tetratricopeptide repeat protein [bacterium]|nr:tetratricopeptide repeat protein [bacterium]